MRQILLLLCASGALAAATPNWPQFRGPNASGVAEDARPPVHFGPGTNLLWKISSPPGISAPIVWRDRIFLTGLADKKLVTLAYDAGTGRELWRRTAPAEKLEECHEFSSPAASTPCTDGQRVYAYFGSYGLIAYDFAGQEVWRRPLERLPSQYGTATSPILAGGAAHFAARWRQHQRDPGGLRTGHRQNRLGIAASPRGVLLLDADGLAS